MAWATTSVAALTGLRMRRAAPLDGQERGVVGLEEVRAWHIIAVHHSQHGDGFGDGIRKRCQYVGFMRVFIAPAMRYQCLSVNIGGTTLWQQSYVAYIVGPVHK